MKKVVINNCYGGFGLSHKGVMRYAEIKGMALYPWIDDITKRVYGDKAIIGDDEVLHHYCTSPVVDGGCEKGTYFSVSDISRDDPALIRVVEEMGGDASGRHSQLEVVEIPDGVDFVIEEYDGNEWIAEEHRTWS